LGKEQTISKTAMLVKGESSHWINQRKLIQKKFEWQDEYIALSVSHSAVNKVRNYIANQEEHHKKKTFAQEYNEFLEAHQFESFRLKP
jgi:putative transposase